MLAFPDRTQTGSRQHHGGLETHLGHRDDLGGAGGRVGPELQVQDNLPRVPQAAQVTAVRWRRRQKVLLLEMRFPTLRRKL